MNGSCGKSSEANVDSTPAQSSETAVPVVAYRSYTVASAGFKKSSYDGVQLATKSSISTTTLIAYQSIYLSFHSTLGATDHWRIHAHRF
jgi:hypothetical protein